MKYAALPSDGSMWHAAQLLEGTEGVCVGCGGAVYVSRRRRDCAHGSDDDDDEDEERDLQGEGCAEWAHRGGGGDCPLVAESLRRVNSATAEPVAAKENEANATSSSRRTVYKYAPGFFGDVALMYLTDANSAPPPGFLPAKWFPQPIRVIIDDTVLEARIVKLATDGDELGEVVVSVRTLRHAVPARGAAGDGARRALQRFHRTAMLRIDPRHSQLPTWRAIRAPPGGGKTTLLFDLARAFPDVRFGLVTFARDIAEELRHRMLTDDRGALDNLSVKTLDALCYAAEFGTAGVHQQADVVPRLESRDVVQSAYPRCRPWNKKRGSAGIGPSLEHALRLMPLGFGVGDADRLLCEKHSEFDWILKALAAPNPPTGGTRAAGEFARLRTSFAAMRARAGRTAESQQRLRGALSGVDVLLIDEAQDLTQQALQILRGLAIPTIAVGDPRQRVYGYADARACADCARCAEELLVGGGPTGGPTGDGGFADATREETLDLYETHRLDPLTCRLVGEWTRGRLGMVSTRTPPTSEAAAVATVVLVRAVPPQPEPLLLLVRSNRELIEAASADPSLGVVGGRSLSADLRYNRPPAAPSRRRGRDRLSAIESIALSLCERGELESVCAMLEERDAPLASAQHGRAVSSIHRCKGAEAPHVAVFKSVIVAAAGDDDGAECPNDLCVMIVALTRHTRRLSIVVAEEAEGADDATGSAAGGGKRRRVGAAARAVGGRRIKHARALTAN